MLLTQLAVVLASSTQPNRQGVTAINSRQRQATYPPTTGTRIFLGRFSWRRSEKAPSSLAGGSRPIAKPTSHPIDGTSTAPTSPNAADDFRVVKLPLSSAPTRKSGPFFIRRAMCRTQIRQPRVARRLPSSSISGVRHPWRQRQPMLCSSRHNIETATVRRPRHSRAGLLKPYHRRAALSTRFRRKRQEADVVPTPRRMLERRALAAAAGAARALA